MRQPQPAESLAADEAWDYVIDVTEPRYETIAKEILEMVEEDQRLRMALMQRDRADTERLRAIVAEIGWPTRSKVGELAEHRAWLLLQHADGDRPFQQQCLELMKHEPPGEVCASHIAYLEDRLSVAFGKPQRYGTQLHGGPDGLEPLPIEDPERVDERRASVGLQPLAEYVETATRGPLHAEPRPR
jgi:hypothetical protein